MRRTDTTGMGAIKSRIPALMLDKMGVKSIYELNLYAISKEIGLSRSSVEDWLLDNVRRFDVEMLLRWRAYFGVESVGDLLEFVPDGEAEAERPGVGGGN